MLNDWQSATTPPREPGIYEVQYAHGSRKIELLRWNGATGYRRGWRSLDNAYPAAFGSAGDRWRVRVVNGA